MPRTTLRLPNDLYDAIKSVIHRRDISFNTFVKETLRREVATEQEREMYEVARLLGADPDSNVDYALDAQSEVALGDEARSE